MLMLHVPLISSNANSTAYQTFASTMYVHMHEFSVLYLHVSLLPRLSYSSLLDSPQWRTEKFVEKIENSDATILAHVIH